MVQSVDTSQLDSNHKGRGRSVGGGFVGKNQLWGVVRHTHANQQDRENVEDEDTEEGQTNGAGDRLARVLGLSHRHSDQLSSQEGKGGCDHSGPEAEEFASAALFDIRLESTTSSQYGNQYAR